MKVSINKTPQLYNIGTSKSNMHGNVYSYMHTYVRVQLFFNFGMAVKYTFGEVHFFRTILKLPEQKKVFRIFF